MILGYSNLHIFGYDLYKMFTEIGAKGPEKARYSATHKKQAKQKSFCVSMLIQSCSYAGF